MNVLDNNAICRTALRLVVAICSLGGAGLFVPATAAAKQLGDPGLANVHQPESRPTNIPTVRRVQKAKPRTGAVALRTFKKHFVDPRAMRLGSCAAPADYVAHDLDDLPLVEELEVESIGFDTYACPERRSTAALLRVVRIELDDLIYPTDRALAPASVELARLLDARDRIRILPKLPASSEDDGSLIA